jgi:hypothetical protein
MKEAMGMAGSQGMSNKGPLIAGASLLGLWTLRRRRRRREARRAEERRAAAARAERTPAVERAKKAARSTVPVVVGAVAAAKGVGEKLAEQNIPERWADTVTEKLDDTRWRVWAATMVVTAWLFFQWRELRQLKRMTRAVARGQA